MASVRPFVLPGPAQNRLQAVTLPALSGNELSFILMHRLIGVGFQGETLFLEKDLKQIYQQSMGNLNLVNQLAH